MWDGAVNHARAEARSRPGNEMTESGAQNGQVPRDASSRGAWCFPFPRAVAGLMDGDPSCRLVDALCGLGSRVRRRVPVGITG